MSARHELALAPDPKKSTERKKKPSIIRALEEGSWAES
jgi:hypothetical protein